jgi:hypothetical protein
MRSLAFPSEKRLERWGSSGQFRKEKYEISQNLPTFSHHDNGAGGFTAARRHSSSGAIREMRLTSYRLYPTSQRR